MFKKVKNWFVKKFLIKYLIEGIEKLLSKLPGDESKTVTGLFLLAVGSLIQASPDFAPVGQPIIDELQKLPAENITTSGALIAVVGLIHKLFKYLVRKFADKEDL